MPAHRPGFCPAPRLNRREHLPGELAVLIGLEPCCFSNVLDAKEKTAPNGALDLDCQWPKRAEYPHGVPRGAM